MMQAGQEALDVNVDVNVVAAVASGFRLQQASRIDGRLQAAKGAPLADLKRDGFLLLSTSPAFQERKIDNQTSPRHCHLLLTNRIQTCHLYPYISSTPCL